MRGADPPKLDPSPKGFGPQGEERRRVLRRISPKNEGYYGRKPVEASFSKHECYIEGAWPVPWQLRRHNLKK
jgi:hypothetical protein